MELLTVIEFRAIAKYLCAQIFTIEGMFIIMFASFSRAGRSWHRSPYDCVAES